MGGDYTVHAMPRRTPPKKRTLPTHSRDGVDLTLIRWFLTLTPLQRLRVLRRNALTLSRLHGAATRR